jgi:hypothetical protein
MIERLVLALRALARAPEPDLQHEFAHDFDDAYLVFSQCQQLEVTAAQRDALVAVEHLLDRVRAESPTSIHQDLAVQRPDDVGALRAAAHAALRELGYADVGVDRAPP